MSRYGIMTTNNAASPQAGITNVPVKLGSLGASHLYNGTDTLPDDNKIVIKVSGIYQIFAQVSFQKDTADDQDIFSIFLYKNGVTTGYGFARDLKLGESDLGSGSLWGILDLNVGDVLELYIYNSAGAASTVTVVNAQFGVVSQ